MTCAPRCACRGIVHGCPAPLTPASARSGPCCLGPCCGHAATPAASKAPPTTRSEACAAAAGRHACYHLTVNRGLPRGLEALGDALHKPPTNLNELDVTDATDTLFSDPLRAPGPFRFDADVVRVFPDMIRRSVPGYETVVAMTGLLAGRFVAAGSTAYDLGCSLGASTLAMRRHIQTPDARIVAVDNSPAMIEHGTRLLGQAGAGCPVELREDDIRDTAISDASMVVLNYTLQFVTVAERLRLLSRIAQALRPGGILVLSEKVILPDAALDALNVELHHDFKRAHGYSDLEIAAKRDSLDNVLRPETLADHRARLREAGFRSSDVWFQCFNFASLIALK